MPSYKRPGIYVNEFLSTTSTVETGSTTDAVFIGSHHRGPVDEAVYITSWTQFQTIFGGFPPAGTDVSELPHAIYNYFTNGGRGVYVVRVATATAASGSVTLTDRAGTPLSTLAVRAKSAGTWGNNLRVSVIDRDAVNGRFDIAVFEGGTSPAFQVERWNDLSMVDSDPRYVEKVINSDTAGSAFIEVEDLDSGTAAPGDMPASVSGAALSGGASGGAIGTTELTAAVSAGSSPLDVIDGLATVNMPGVTAAAAIGALLTYCENSGRLFAVVDPPQDTTPADAVGYAQTLTASSYGAVYYPWIVTADPTSNAPGATRVSPPGAFAVGKIAETDTSRGVWKAPAGINVRLAGAVGLERTLTSGDLETLNEGNVNAIRHMPGAGIVIMGARTLENTLTADKYVNVRRTLNYIKDSAVRSTEFAIFENNDYSLWLQIESALRRFLTGVYSGGGLKGNSPDEAFYVKCNADLNTPAVIDAGEVRVEIGVALQKPAEFVVIRIGQWDGGSTATEA